MPNPEGVSGGYKMFLLGDTFLRGFFSVYDFENQMVQLGVNIHAKDYVKITAAKDFRIVYFGIIGGSLVVSIIMYFTLTYKLKDKMKKEAI